MRISDWSSDVCSSDLVAAGHDLRADRYGGFDRIHAHLALDYRHAHLVAVTSHREPGAEHRDLALACPNHEWACGIVLHLEVGFATTQQDFSRLGGDGRAHPGVDRKSIRLNFSN